MMNNRFFRGKGGRESLSEIDEVSTVIASYIEKYIDFSFYATGSSFYKNTALRFSLGSLSVSRDVSRDPSAPVRYSTQSTALVLSSPIFGVGLLALLACHCRGVACLRASLSDRSLSVCRSRACRAWSAHSRGRSDCPFVSPVRSAVLACLRGPMRRLGLCGSVRVRPL
jgi:hypothetical protein